MNTEKDILLRRIANHLILHSIDIEDIGLFHGKMGVVLFFAHYARYTDQAIYDDFAGELLEEISENIPETLPINLETGLCGIGWGIEYLIQNGFMEGDSNEILAGIDQYYCISVKHFIPTPAQPFIKHKFKDRILLSLGCFDNK